MFSNHSVETVFAHNKSGRGALMQWLKLPAWKVGDRGFELWPSSFKETNCFFPAHS